MSLRRGSSRQSFPAVRLDGAALVAQAPYLRALVRAMGVPSQDQEDIIGEVTAAAWSAMIAGLYQPDPEVRADAALQRWLGSIGRRQVGRDRQHFVCAVVRWRSPRS